MRSMKNYYKRETVQIKDDEWTTGIKWKVLIKFNKYGDKIRGNI